VSSDILAFLAFRAAAESGEQVHRDSLPENTLKQLGEWGKSDGWWNREWATAIEAADALDIELGDLQSMVDAKELVGYDLEGALHIPSRDLAVAAWEKAKAGVE
jgi:hypothetical protein